jgi:hypothetical protein
VTDSPALPANGTYRAIRAGGPTGFGEPSLTADARYLYFVHVLSDAEGDFDADVWLSERLP